MRIFKLNLLTIISLCFITSSCQMLDNEKHRPMDFVEINKSIPEAIFDIRYFGSNNFVGRAVDGYLQAKCILQTKAANALVKISL